MSAQEAEEYYMPNATTVWYSWLYTDPRENLTEANIHDGQVRDVFYTENIEGEIVKRQTTGTAPDSRYYYFGGIRRCSPSLGEGRVLERFMPNAKSLRAGRDRIGVRRRPGKCPQCKEPSRTRPIEGVELAHDKRL